MPTLCSCADSIATSSSEQHGYEGPRRVFRARPVYGVPEGRPGGRVNAHKKVRKGLSIFKGVAAAASGHIPLRQNDAAAANGPAPCIS